MMLRGILGKFFGTIFYTSLAFCVVTATNASTAQAGPALCDLSGDWVQRNTRTNEIHPLVWRIQRIANEGTPEAWTYEVTRYKNGTRFAPPSSGRLYQSAKETLIFFDTPASMSRYNLSRIMSLREVAVRPGCQAMDVLSIIGTWKGTRHPGRGVLVMERRGVIRSGGPAPVPPPPGAGVSTPPGSKVPQVPAPKPLPGWKPPVQSPKPMPPIQ